MMLILFVILIDLTLCLSSASIGEVCTTNTDCKEGECLFYDGKKRCEICDHFDPKEPIRCKYDTDCCSRKCHKKFCSCSKSGKWCEHDVDCCSPLVCSEEKCQVKSCSFKSECSRGSCVNNECRKCKNWNSRFIDPCEVSDDCCSERCIGGECHCSTHHERQNFCKKKSNCCKGYSCVKNKCCIRDGKPCVAGSSSSCCSKTCDSKSKLCISKDDDDTQGAKVDGTKQENSTSSNTCPTELKCEDVHECSCEENECPCCSLSDKRIETNKCRCLKLRKRLYGFDRITKYRKVCCMDLGGKCGNSSDCCTEDCTNGKCTGEYPEAAYDNTGCFSVNSKVRGVEGEIVLKEARIGDKIHYVTKNGEMEETEIVMVYIHKKLKRIKVIEYLASCESSSLRITGNHYIYFSSLSSMEDIVGSKMRLADQIRVGDYVVVMCGDKHEVGQVKDIREEESVEVGTVYTKSGKLIVDGVLASSYSISHLGRSRLMRGFEISVQKFAMKVLGYFEFSSFKNFLGVTVEYFWHIF